MILVAFIISTIAFCVLGVFSGWIVGSSNTPVVAAFLPLLFGLITLFITSILNNIKINQEYFQLKVKLSISSQDSIQKDKKEKNPIQIFQYISIGSFLIICFCCTTFAGLQLGINQRIPAYHFSIVDIVPPSVDIHPEEYSLIYKVYLTFQSKGIPEEFAKKMLKDSIYDLYKLYPQNNDESRGYYLKAIVNNFLSDNIEINRGPRMKPQ